MTKRNRLYLARQENGLHVLIRIFPKEVFNQNFCATPKEVNKLLESKNILSLLKAIEQFGPLLTCALVESENTRFYPIEKLSDDPIRDMGLSSVHLPSLIRETVFELPCESGEHVYLTRKVSKKYGIDREGFNDDLSEHTSSEVVVIEPLQEWLFLRNTLSLFGRIIYARQENTFCDTMLESIGFERRSNRKLKTDVFAIPFQFNTWFATNNTTKNLIHPLTTSPERHCPLLWRIFTKSFKDTNDSFIGRLLKGDAHFVLKDSPDILILTAPQATGRRASVINNKNYEDKRLYLAIREDGRSQIELSEHLIISFIKHFIDDFSLIDAQSVFDGNRSYSPTPSNLAAACWMTLVNHPGYYLIRCKACGSVVFASDVGRERIFCSNACFKTFNSN
jgi:hypothetical protein